MSISMRSGMSLGRQSTSISRVTKSTNPPSVLTPTASPLGTMGMVTRMTLSMAIWMRSAWMSSSLTGSIWSSRIIASRISPPNPTLKSVFSRVSVFRIRTTSFFSRARGTLAVDLPVQDGGDAPLFPQLPVGVLAEGFPFLGLDRDRHLFLLS